MEDRRRAPPPLQSHYHHRSGGSEVASYPQWPLRGGRRDVQSHYWHEPRCGVTSSWTRSLIDPPSSATSAEAGLKSAKHPFPSLHQIQIRPRSTHVSSTFASALYTATRVCCQHSPIPAYCNPWDHSAAVICWIRLTLPPLPTPDKLALRLQCGFGFGLYLLRHSSTPSCIDIMAATVASSQAPPNLNSTPGASSFQQQQQQQVNDDPAGPASTTHQTPEPLPATKTFTPDDFKLVRTLGTGTLHSMSLSY